MRLLPIALLGGLVWPVSAADGLRGTGTISGPKDSIVSFEEESGGDDDVFHRSLAVEIRLFGNCNFTLVADVVEEGQVRISPPQIIYGNTAEYSEFKVGSGYDQGIEGSITYACLNNVNASLTLVYKNPLIGDNECSINYNSTLLSVEVVDGGCGPHTGDHAQMVMDINYLVF